MQKCLVLCMVLLALVSADGCPDGGMCAEGNTCCKAPSNDYKCCPLHQAECCEDHIHCCPMGTLCLVNESTCVNGTVSLPWVERVSAKQSTHLKSFRMISTYAGDEDDKICSDNSHCPPEFSCLQTTKGFGCCPVAQALSCSDGKHCCPQGHQCSTDGQSCIRLKDPVVPVMCNDGESECPGETTCCETPDGRWGCCPMPKAVCCEDKIHCCPDGSTCDIKQSKCISASNKEMPMWAKFPARIRAEWENPKKVTTPVPDTTTSTNTILVPLWEGAKSSPLLTRAKDVPCNDTKSCEDGSTCCKTEKGEWACCPLPQAVCCSDFIHCCPHGKICNLPAQTCEDPSGKSSEPWLEKVPAVPQKVKRPADVPCDPSHKCPDNTTCCKTETGDWACCPLPEAVCCEDHVHCCPHDTTCDPATLMCNGASGPIPMVGKVRAFTTPAPDHEESPTKDQGELSNYIEMPKSDEEGDQLAKIQCDSHTTCPKDTTCCFIKSTQKWGCCPLPQAVCCADGEHCCPKDYKCDVSRTTCTKGKVTIPWYNKLAAQSEDAAQVPAASLRCDAQSRCPEGSSCCKLSTGHWSCCPLRQAVCCGDEGHCCPQGYSCNLGMGTCQKLMLFQFQTVPLTRVSAPEPLTPQGAEVQCGGTFVCQDRETCCKISATTWACCPAPNAVCCEDMKHCCPTGYTCEEGRSCVQSNGFNWAHWQVFFSNKRKALRV